MNMLENVNDQNWEAFVASPLSLLLVTEANCPHCRAWKEELAQYLQEVRFEGKARFGVLVLDGEGVDDFKEANQEWLDIIDGLPFNAIYVDGEPMTSFYGGGVKRMKNRIERILSSGDEGPGGE